MSDSGPTRVGQRGLQSVGEYNRVTRKVVIPASIASGKWGKTSLMHSLGHAISHTRATSKTLLGSIPVLRALQSRFESEELEVKTLYANFQARANLADAVQARADLTAAGDGTLPGTGDCTARSAYGSRDIRYTREGGSEEFVVTPGNRSPQGATVSLDVPLEGGATAAVDQRGESSDIRMPAGAAPATSETVWSEWARDAHMVLRPSEGAEYYLAEGYSHFLQGGEQAEKLQRMDPGLHSLVAARLAEDYAIRP